MAICLLTMIGFRLLISPVEQAILFPGARASASPPVLPEGGRLERIETPAGLVEGILLSPSTASDQPAPLVIYCHGNGELIDFHLDQFDEFRDAGFAVLLAEYPGYGRSQGKASERSIRQAITAIYDWAIQQPGIDPKQVIGYGRSLGGGAICLLARDRTLAAVILESTFSSVPDVAKIHYGWLSHFLTNRFDNRSVMETLKSPVLILHGEHDRIIPASQSRQLHECCPGSELVILPCDHNDCDSAPRLACRFLKQQEFLTRSP